MYFIAQSTDLRVSPLQLFFRQRSELVSLDIELIQIHWGQVELLDCPR